MSKTARTLEFLAPHCAQFILTGLRRQSFLTWQQWWNNSWNGHNLIAALFCDLPPPPVRSEEWIREGIGKPGPRRSLDFVVALCRCICMHLLSHFELLGLIHENWCSTDRGPSRLRLEGLLMSMGIQPERSLVRGWDFGCFCQGKSTLTTPGSSSRFSG